MPSDPLVSVVLPAYNASKYLDATLTSILDQTVRDLEVIVVDDGSSDDTADLLRAWQRRDARVLPVVLPANVGRSQARNIGIEHARGDWVAMTDADDLWARHRLATIVLATREFPASTVFTDDWIGFQVDGDGSVTLSHRYPSSVTWSVGPAHEVKIEPWYVGRGCHMNPVIRRDFLQSSGVVYPTDLAAGEDLVFTSSLVFLPGAPPPVRIAQPTFYYREGESLRTLYSGALRLAVDEAIFEQTGSEAFREMAARVQPGWSWIIDRADEVFVSTGRAGAKDDRYADRPYRSSAWQGRRILNLNRACVVASKLADRRLRPQIIADIQRQFAATVSPRDDLAAEI